MSSSIVSSNGECMAESPQIKSEQWTLADQSTPQYNAKVIRNDHNKQRVWSEAMRQGKADAPRQSIKQFGVLDLKMKGIPLGSASRTARNNRKPSVMWGRRRETHANEQTQSKKTSTTLPPHDYKENGAQFVPPVSTKARNAKINKQTRVDRRKSRPFRTLWTQDSGDATIQFRGRKQLMKSITIHQ